VAAVAAISTEKESLVLSVLGFADEGGSQRMVIEGWICVDVEEKG
jgi:hypothetical protein